VSHSRDWQSTLIVTVEDDAQDGPDHVDAHRAPTLLISPYTQTGLVDSTHYDTASALSTLEALLGMPPMSTFDARAVRMWPAFLKTPDLTPYDAIQPTVIPYGAPGYPVNPPDAPLAGASLQMDFSAPDRIPEELLNEAVWQSVKGAGSRMPAPRHRLLIPAGAVAEPATAPALESDDVSSAATARLRDALRNLGAGPGG
jgi:hypothetical protein